MPTPEYIKKLYSKLIYGGTTFKRGELIYLGKNDAFNHIGDLYIKIVDPVQDEYVLIAAEDNKLIYEKSYKGGKLNGRFAQYKNGLLTREGLYIDDLKDGKWVEYNSSGNIDKTIEWHCGVKHGKVCHYKNDTVIVHTEIWKNGYQSVDDK